MLAVPVLKSRKPATRPTVASVEIAVKNDAGNVLKSRTTYGCKFELSRVRLLASRVELNPICLLSQS